MPSDSADQAEPNTGRSDGRPPRARATVRYTRSCAISSADNPKNIYTFSNVHPSVPFVISIRVLSLGRITVLVLNRTAMMYAVVFFLIVRN